MTEMQVLIWLGTLLGLLVGGLGVVAGMAFGTWLHDRAAKRATEEVDH
jgi:hypothetical protein